MTTVVLGWDALDFELLEEFDLRSSFGGHSKEIDTFDNEVLGKPHTDELWPSIITGARPDEHGVYAAASEDGLEWEDNWLNLLSDLAQGVVPKRLRAAIGRYLRHSGAKQNYKNPEYYRKHGIGTVFDGRRAIPLSIPNCRTSLDTDLDVIFDRGAQLSAFTTIETLEDGTKRHTPTVPLPLLEQRLAGEASKKLGIVEAALHREYDLIFVWLGYLDTIGHVAPIVDEDGFQHRHYKQAAEWTQQLHTQLPADDELLCVSDHGLRQGAHTHAATITSTHAGIDAVESVLDVRKYIDDITSRSGDSDNPPVREPFIRQGNRGEQGASEVRDRLEDLGYL